MNRFLISLICAAIVSRTGAYSATPPDTFQGSIPLRADDAPAQQSHRSSRPPRGVPGSSYALPTSEDIGFKIDVPAPPSVGDVEQISYDGNFTYGYNADNGISVSVKGYQKTIKDKTFQVMEGSYSYTAPDGTTVSVVWYADEKGFHPTVIKHT